MTILRNSDGFASALEGERHANFKRPLPMDYITLMEDFIAATSAIPPGWTHTTTNGTLALASGTVLTQTLGGADNDASQLQATTATLALVAGKRAFFRWRGKVDKGAAGTIGQEEVYIGLGAAQTTTSFVNAGGTALTVDDFVGFASYDASTAINCVARKTDVESAFVAGLAYADATYMELAWDFDGSALSFWKDANYLGAVSTGFPTAALAPVLYVKAGAAHAKVLTTDYIFTAIER